MRNSIFASLCVCCCGHTACDRSAMSGEPDHDQDLTGLATLRTKLIPVDAEWRCWQGASSCVCSSCSCVLHIMSKPSGGSDIISKSSRGIGLEPSYLRVVTIEGLPATLRFVVSCPRPRRSTSADDHRLRGSAAKRYALPPNLPGNCPVCSFCSLSKVSEEEASSSRFEDYHRRRSRGSCPSDCLLRSAILQISPSSSSDYGT